MLFRMRVIPRGLRTFVIITLIAAIGVAGWLGVGMLRVYRANLRELKCTLSTWDPATLGERVLVVAPHCDDETLGCAGLIRDAVRRGGEVRVVVVTNGDGYYEIVRRVKKAGPKSYIEFGRKRQKETLAAMRLLGLSDDDVIFLGYPDRGIAGMWMGNWEPDQPYTSRYTKCSYSPYEDSFRKNAPYCGRALLADLESIILSFRPTVIYHPHPSDHHPDHWAVHCFVSQALFELNLHHSIKAGLYIVHRGDWPIPQGLHPALRLVPPAFLCGIGMNWYQYDLDKEDIATKLNAIRAYRSQLTYLGEYLYSFDRTNELVGTYEPSIISYIVGGRDSEQIWAGISPVIMDPIGDSVKVEVGRGGDIRQVKAYFDNRNLHVRMELAHPHSRRMTYRISVCGMPDATAERIEARVNGRRPADTSVRVKRNGNTIDVALPLSRLGKWDALMICADTSLENRSLDRTAWRLLMREGGESRPHPNLRPADRRDHRTPLLPARRPL